MRAGIRVHRAVATDAQAQQVRRRLPAMKSPDIGEVVRVVPGGDKSAPSAAVMHGMAEPFAARRPRLAAKVTVDLAAVRAAEHGPRVTERSGRGKKCHRCT